MSARWVAWERLDSSGTAAIDDQLERGTRNKLHRVPEDVGGYADQGNGQEGRAACGVKVPADNPDVIAWWVFNGERCKWCEPRPQSQSSSISRYGSSHTTEGPGSSDTD